MPHTIKSDKSGVFNGTIEIESDAEGSVTFHFNSSGEAFGFYIEVSKEVASEMEVGLNCVLSQKSWGYDIKAE